MYVCMNMFTYVYIHNMFLWAPTVCRTPGMQSGESHFLFAVRTLFTSFYMCCLNVGPNGRPGNQISHRVQNIIWHVVSNGGLISDFTLNVKCHLTCCVKWRPEWRLRKPDFTSDAEYHLTCCVKWRPRIPDFTLNVKCHLTCCVKWWPA